MISMIVAHDNGYVIGINNDLPWDLPNDLKYFQEQTLHKTVIMGRKTFESIGRALPKRRNIVITRDKNYHAEGIEVVHSVEEAIELAKADSQQPEIMVIGGEQIFKEALPIADRLYITLVESNFEGDTFFPQYENDFIEVSCGDEQEHEGIKFIYKIFERGER